MSGIENQERLKEARTVSHLDGLRDYIVAKETVVKPWFETDKNWEQFGLSRDGCKALLRRLVADRAEGNQPIYLYKATVNGYTRKRIYKKTGCVLRPAGGIDHYLLGCP